MSKNTNGPEVTKLLPALTARAIASISSRLTFVYVRYFARPSLRFPSGHQSVSATPLMRYPMFRILNQTSCWVTLSQVLPRTTMAS